MNNQLVSLQIEDFKLILNQFDIHLNKVDEENLLSALRNNQYALLNETYQFILEDYIKKLTSQMTSQSIHSLFNYFKEPLNV